MLTASCSPLYRLNFNCLVEDNNAFFKESAAPVYWVSDWRAGLPSTFFSCCFYDNFIFMIALLKSPSFSCCRPNCVHLHPFSAALCSRLNRVCCCSHSLRTPHRPRPSRRSGSPSWPTRTASAARRNDKMVTWYPQQHTVGIFILPHKSHYVNYAGFSMYRDTRTLENLSSYYRPLRYKLWWGGV